MIALVASSALASYNRDGLWGVHKTHSAQTGGKSKMAAGVHGDLMTDTDAFENNLATQSGATTEISSVSALNGYPFFGLAMTNHFEAAIVFPLYYELIEGLDNTDIIGFGDIKATAKFNLPLPKEGNIADVALILGLEGGTSVIGDGGVLPREPDYINLEDNRETRAFGRGALSAQPNLAVTLDFNRLSSSIPLLIHANVAYRYSMEDYPAMTTLRGAFEVNPLEYISLYAEGVLDIPTAQFNSGEDLNFLTIAAGGIVHTPIGMDVVAGVTGNPTSYKYIDNVSSPEKSTVANMQPYPQVKVHGALIWSGYLMAQDKDKDGVIDELDQCPGEQEDKDGYQDGDGCPDLDNDKDGIPDAEDKCPSRPEDVDGFEDEDGCPEMDNDNDKIPDDRDQCPLEAEDKDGFDDGDGCPELDNDKDGIPDDKDKCPNQREDLDNFQDEDGCPDLDNDGDGILDEKDKCPDKKENVNGVEDADGCPDKEAPKTKPITKQITLHGVKFKTGTAELTFEAQQALNGMAEQLLDQKSVHIEIRGHTDNVGDSQANYLLSEQRANSVKQYFVSKGVEPSRMEAKGFGEAQPIASNNTAAGRAQNRRIEIYRTK